MPIDYHLQPEKSQRHPCSSKIALIVSQSHIPSDGRALRFGETLKNMGYHVIGVGFCPYDRHAPPRTDVPFPVQQSPAPVASTMRRLLMALALAPTLLVPKLSHGIYRIVPENRRMRQVAQNLVASLTEPLALVVAKHWSALPVAIGIVQCTGAKLLYDANEISHAEHEEDWKWRLFYRSYAIAIERYGLARADQITTFGSAAANEITSFNGLSRNISVVRNVPYRFSSAQPTQEKTLTFLYHGLAAKDRGLEQLIDSVQWWTSERRLVLRLTGEPGYIDQLRARIAALSLEQQDKVDIVPPVPNDQVVAAACEADVGLCLLPAHSRQKLFAEPNKLYQHIAAGNAVLVSDLPALKTIVAELGCGQVCREHNPSSIARAVNSLTMDRVQHLKQASKLAAEHLCWEREQDHLKKAVESIN